jgi:hypothetical protein
MRHSSTWKFRKEVNLSMVVQLCLMASLVAGSWFNLERRIAMLQHDVDALLKGQERFTSRVEQLSADAVRHEYKLEIIERRLAREDRL